jgi:hypothetical protein
MNSLNMSCWQATCYVVHATTFTEDYMSYQMTRHAKARAQQRAIPPLIEAWLDEFGDEEYDGLGGVRIFFSRRSIRRLERVVGRLPVRLLSHLLDAYKVESTRDGSTLTYARKTARMRRR